MSYTVEQGGCRLWVSKDGDPFAKRQVGCDDQRGFLIELAKEVK